MVRIYTAQYGYRGEARLDITVKSGDRVFAPTWSMVTALKSGRITPDEYTALYRALMRRSLEKNPRRWQEVLALDEAVLVCFCPSGSFCHRLLLAEILQDMGAKYLGEIT